MSIFRSSSCAEHLRDACGFAIVDPALSADGQNAQARIPAALMANACPLGGSAAARVGAVFCRNLTERRTAPFSRAVPGASGCISALVGAQQLTSWW